MGRQKAPFWSAASLHAELGQAGSWLAAPIKCCLDPSPSSFEHSAEDLFSLLEVDSGLGELFSTSLQDKNPWLASHSSLFLLPPCQASGVPEEQRSTP